MHPRKVDSRPPTGDVPGGPGEVSLFDDPPVWASSAVWPVPTDKVRAPCPWCGLPAETVTTFEVEAEDDGMPPWFGWPPPVRYFLMEPCGHLVNAFGWAPL